MKSMSEEYDPEKVVGVPYQRGLLPYGGGLVLMAGWFSPSPVGGQSGVLRNTGHSQNE